MSWSGPNNGIRHLRIMKDGSRAFASEQSVATAAGSVRQTASDLVPLSAGDDVDVRVLHDATSTAYVEPDGHTFLAMHWVSPLAP